MPKKQEDRIVLDYHDSLLRESDLILLNSSNWLSDQIIGFVYEYFEFEKYKNLVEENKIVFLNPNFTQILKLNEDVNQLAECFLNPLEANNKDVVIFPINNNSEPLSAGGSHWSLLVIYKKLQKFIHYDSLHSSNKNIAFEIFNKLKSYFNCKAFENEINCPQQINTSDCGVYLLAYSDAVANSILANKSVDLSHITPEYINNLRSFYKNLIISLKNKE